ncbi:hypothetical protein FZC84_00570 [Rossellomorea vietnamensis]|uniref:Uncharacterized protein n=1 Tax=Rossellomorea vietnamensis TaxID=218284 RepID=A0A5D4MHZ9_9BACI|nr:hypothetical protein [Rossellomorea vietnamensis]TYS01197.1 hypothetical protein FZC84_00570 [Rossellomorea vietnamensis]
MNRITFSIVIIILLINAGRYSSYLLEGSSSIYYLSMFLLNIAGLITMLVQLYYSYKNKGRD